MPTAMTSKQINAKYDRFLAVFLRDGVENSKNNVKLEGKFKDVKQTAINLLKGQLERAHGRGNHCVKVFGMIQQNVTPEKDIAVGFLPQWDWVRDEEVFSL